VLFIATANSLDTIHPALRDRMEIIEINGYTVEEKMQIAKSHLLPRIKADHGLGNKQLKADQKVIQLVIDGYTRESGVRQLNQQLSTLARKVVRQVVTQPELEVKLTPALVEEYLGPARFDLEQYQKVEIPGVAIGMAWTPVGGEILFIETALSRGTGRFSLTGQLGDVMKESANLAYIWLKAHAQQYNIPADAFRHWDLHIHIPAGAVPKDGPSAGIALLSAMTSALCQRKVKVGLAMTGEITLRGKVLPVGGIKEKVLAAARAGIKEVILCRQNRKDLEQIKEDTIRSLTVHYVEHMEEVLQLALEPKPVRQPVDLVIPESEKNQLRTSPAL
ncbi:MAG: S16 family serine protease, partial [Sphingobacteriia bacterium]